MRSNGDFLDEHACGGNPFAGRFEVEGDCFEDIAAGVVQTIAFGDTARQGWNIRRVTAFLALFKNDS
jgi:hypothetical protein